MKFRSLSRWTYSDELEGLLYFAQRLDEMLFNYALDTYKPSALNSSLLCIEALDTIRYTKSGVFDRNHKNVETVLEELRWSVGLDLTAKSLLDLDLDQYAPKASSVNIEDLRIRLKLLYSSIEPERYQQRNAELLSIAIKENKKKDIECLVRTFVTYLLYIGYHQSYLYHTSQDYFFYGDNQIDSLDDFSEFIAPFDGKNREYAVGLCISDNILEVKKSCKVFDIEIVENLDDFSDKDLNDNDHNRFIILSKIKALDPFSAREMAERLVEKLRNLYVLFHHKEQIEWGSEAIVKDIESEKSFRIDSPISPMKKGYDMKPQKASKELDRLIKQFSLHRVSFERFNRVIDLHSLSVRNDSPENQLLNVWICLETLIPAKPETSKIQNIINTLVPFLIQNYVRRLVERLTADLVLWNRKIVTELLKKVPNGKSLSLHQKVGALLVLESTADLRSELYVKLGHFVLLRNRVFSLSESLKSTKKIVKLLETHEKKVTWQLRRIYRARNLIVHTATTPRYIGTLIENAHDYLDAFLEQTKEFACAENTIDTIEEVVKFVSLSTEARMKKLMEKDVECDEENYIEILFGKGSTQSVLH